MYTLITLPYAVLLLVWTSCASSQADTPQSFKAEGQSPAPIRAPSPNNQAQNVLSLQQKFGTSTSASYVQSLRKGSQVNGVYGVQPLTAVESGLVFVADVTIGGEAFEAVIDTGSSDTWIAETGIDCAKGSGACKFGPTYNQTSTFSEISNENFNISYTDGEFLNGIFGHEQVTVAGITVENQQVAIVDTASWNGDGLSSGVIGLAFPANTKAFTGDNPRLDGATNQVQYNPLFTNMYTEGSVYPIFSLALTRGSTGGYLALGGLPDVPYFPVFASAPFQLLTTQNVATPAATTNSTPQYTFYTITTSGFTYQDPTQSYWPNIPKPNDQSNIQVLIDSGTSLIYLPTRISGPVNALFDPPAQYNVGLDAYQVDCNATAPTFGVQIGGETFFIDSRDMIVQLSPTVCISGVAATGSGGNSILGHVFLKNVLAVFDVGASEMRFAAREFYGWGGGDKQTYSGT